MADTRHINSPATLVEEIDSSLVKIHDAFRKAFCEGKEKPEKKEEAYKVTLFDDVWALLSHELKFQSLKELTTYYEGVLSSLEVYIDDFCVNKSNILKEDISENKRKMLLQIADVYYAMQRQRYILSKFKPGDEAEVFNKHAADIKLACDQAEQAIQSVNAYEIKKMISTLNEIFSTIATTLNAQNYINRNFPFRKSDDVRADLLFLSPIVDALKQLPTSSKMVEVTRNFEQARRNRDQNEVEAHKLDIKLMQMDIRDVVNKLDRALSNVFNAYRRVIDELTESNRRVATKLMNINQYARLLDIYQLLQEMDGYDERDDVIKKDYKQLLTDAAVKTQAACNMQSSAEKLSFGFYAKGWKLAGIEVNSSLDMLAKKTDVFISEYADLKTMLQMIKRVKDQKKILEDLCETLRTKIGRGEEAWNECKVAINTIDNDVLESYVRVNDGDTVTYIKSFLLEHWWKMGIGGAGASGGTTALAIFAFALNPVAVSVLAVAGGMGGIAVSGGVSHLFKEYFNGKSHEEQSAGEARPLLEPRQEQSSSWLPKLKFWSNTEANSTEPVERIARPVPHK